MDLLGRTHHRLLMCCLSEVASSGVVNTKATRTQVENGLKEWLFSELRENGYGSMLVEESEFPEGILEALLMTQSHGMLPQVLSALRRRPNNTTNCLDVAVQWLKPQNPKDLQLRACRSLLTYRKSVSAETRAALVLSLNSLIRDEELSISKRIGYLTHIFVPFDEPWPLLNEYDSLIKDSSIEPKFRISIMQHIARRPSSLSQRVLLTLNTLSNDVSTMEEIRVQAARALQWNIIDALPILRISLEDADYKVRRRTLEALFLCSNLPQDMLYILVDILKSADRDARNDAVAALQHQSMLPEEILDTLHVLLADEDPTIRRCVVKSLIGQSVLSEKVLRTLTGIVCKDADPESRNQAAAALGEQSVIPPDLLKEIAMLFENPDPNSRANATRRPRQTVCFV
ncbi:hypothetical protein MMC25_005078 [Agyrium rufum]|nr:hypothetical protein [Agyrium rufum]